jgi:hypothetical protein
MAFLLLFGSMFTFEGAQDRSSLDASAQEKAPLATRPVALLDCSFISPLDSYIQERFTQNDRGFGLDRVISFPPKGVHTLGSSPTIYFYSLTRNAMATFTPETDQEKEAVAEIEHSGMKMALYLASRKILTADPELLKASQLIQHAPLRGPVAITQSAQKTDWPDKSSLWKQSLKAMRDFDGDKSATQYEFSAEGKDFIARPVRAQESCLQCHTPQAYLNLGHELNSGGLIRQLSVGDPIGVLLYGYTTPTKSTNIKVP